MTFTKIVKIIANTLVMYRIYNTFGHYLLTIKTEKFSRTFLQIVLNYHDLKKVYIFLSATIKLCSHAEKPNIKNAIIIIKPRNN